MTTAKLSMLDIRTLLLSALGGALEFYDFIIFVFFTKTLSILFFPSDLPEWLSQLQIYGIFAAGYLARPLGGIFMAHFGDKTGRKRMFSLSVFLMALPTLGIGLLPTYTQAGVLAPLLLLIFRLAQGVAIGGEVPAAWVFVAEHLPRHRVGLACASLTSGLTVGILLGSLMASGLYTQFSETELLSYAWRIPFILGGIFGFFAVWLRRWLSETPVFEKLKQEKQIHKDIPLKSVLQYHKKSICISMLVTWMLTASIMVLILMTPTIIQNNFNISAAQAFLGNNLASLALIFGCLFFGALTDALGSSKALFIGSLLLLISTYFLFFNLKNSGDNFFILYSLTGFCTGVVGIVPTIMTSIFPAQIRFTGLSFSYNVAYAFFGAITPPIMAFFSHRVGYLSPAHYVALTCLTCMAVSVYLAKKQLNYFHINN